MSDKEKIKEEIEKHKQEIWPKNTGEMRVVDTPKPLVQGWINALDWVLSIIDSIPEEPEFTEIEKRVVDSLTVRIDNKRIPITLKGDIKAKFRNEFHTMWQIVGEMQFANVAKAIIEKLCLHFAAWGAYNLKGLGDINKEEKAKMDIPKEHNELKKDYRERYKNFSQSDNFKKAYCNKSLGKEEPASEDLESQYKSNMRYQHAYTQDDLMKTKSEDLEEEIERCWKEMFPIGWSDTTLLTLTHDEHAAFAHHFAEWQKRQMMKDAIECIVEDWCGDSPEITIPLNPQDFKTGDKVKIIIVKEEQQ